MDSVSYCGSSSTSSHSKNKIANKSASYSSSRSSSAHKSELHGREGMGEYAHKGGARNEQNNTTKAMHTYPINFNTHKQYEHDLDLRIERRPLSPVNKLNHIDPRVKSKDTANNRAPQIKKIFLDVSATKGDAGVIPPSANPSKASPTKRKHKIVCEARATLSSHY